MHIHSHGWGAHMITFLFGCGLNKISHCCYNYSYHFDITEGWVGDGGCTCYHFISCLLCLWHLFSFRFSNQKWSQLSRNARGGNSLGKSLFKSSRCLGLLDLARWEYWMVFEWDVEREVHYLQKGPRLSRLGMVHWVWGCWNRQLLIILQQTSHMSLVAFWHNSQQMLIVWDRWWLYWDSFRQNWSQGI